MTDKIDEEPFDNEELNDFDTFEEESFDEPFDESLTDDEHFDFDDHDEEPLTAYNDGNYTDDDHVSPSGGINWFNIGIFAFVIITIGGIGYIYLPTILGNSSAPSGQQQPAPIVASAQNQQRLAQQAASETNPAEAVEGGLLNNPDAILDLDANLDESPEDTDQENDLFGALSDEIDTQPNNDSQIPSGPNVDEITDSLPLPSDAAVYLEDITAELDEEEEIVQNVPEMSAEPALIIEEEPTASPPSPSAPATVDYGDEIEQMNDRIDAMNESMNDFMVQLSDKLNSIAMTPPAQPQPSTPVDNSGQIAELKSMIGNLQSEVTALKEEQAAPPAETQPRPVITMEEEPDTNDLASDEQSPTSAPEPASEAQKTVTKKTAPAKAAAQKSTRAYTPPSPTYELRGASNGQAVIAMRGTNNLQTVSPGMVVRGLGQIRSVALENGRWVVRGTQGTVRQ